MTLDWWLRDRRHTDGRWTLAQWPNAAIVVFAIAVAVREVVFATLGVTVIHEAATYIGRGALLVWGLDELTRGINPVRRVLGVAVLVWQLGAIGSAGFA